MHSKNLLNIIQVFALRPKYKTLLCLMLKQFVLLIQQGHFANIISFVFQVVCKIGGGEGLMKPSTNTNLYNTDIQTDHFIVFFQETRTTNERKLLKKIWKEKDHKYINKLTRWCCRCYCELGKEKQQKKKHKSKNIKNKKLWLEITGGVHQGRSTYVSKTSADIHQQTRTLWW